jgi:hypothetical protein
VTDDIDDRIDRGTAIKMIRTALRLRSGKSWSVRGGTGTAWSHIYICAPPSRCIDGFCMTLEETAELSELLGFGDQMHSTTGAIVFGNYREYIDRAKGRKVGEF